MELTWLALSSVLLLGVGYAFVQRAQRSALACWLLLGASLFVLATRDLLRSREQNRPGPTELSADETPERTDRVRPPVFEWIRRYLAGWLR